MKNNNNKWFFNSRGFSLIELIVVIALLGILGAIATTQVADISSKMRVTSAMNQIISDIELTKEFALANSTAMTITYDVNLDRYFIKDNGNLVSNFPGSDNGIISLSNGIFSNNSGKSPPPGTFHVVCLTPSLAIKSTFTGFDSMKFLTLEFIS